MKVMEIKKQKGNIAIIILIALGVLVLGLVAYQQFLKAKPKAKTVIIQKETLQKRSKTPGVIERGLTGKAVDVNTGKIVTAARVFSSDDNTVYLQLDLNAPVKGTLIDYIRYKDGRYVDHGEVTVVRTDTKNLLFNWTINKLLAEAREGNWKIATYTNGILEKRISYSIQKSKVTSMVPEDVNPSDPDYRLHTVIASLSKGQ